MHCGTVSGDAVTIFFFLRGCAGNSKLKTQNSKLKNSKLVPHSSIRRNTDPGTKANKRPVRLFINPRRFPLKNGVRLIHFCFANIIIWEEACSKRSDGSHSLLHPLGVFHAHFSFAPCPLYERLEQASLARGRCFCWSRNSSQ